MFRINIAIDLPDGRAAEFSESPLIVSWNLYREDARLILDRQYEAAKRWLDEQDREAADRG